MTKKSATPDKAAPVTTANPGMMGDGTEEQNLNQTGNPSARITKADVDVAFKTPAKK